VIGGGCTGSASTLTYTQTLAYTQTPAFTQTPGSGSLP
jgi:hypothetical protein